MATSELRVLTESAPMFGAPRLLVVEDSPSDALLVRSYATEAWGEDQTRAVQTIAEARALLESQEVDCILLDLSLPDAQGLEGIATLSMACPDLPIVVVTGAPERDALVLAALAEGAQDYLAKEGLTSAMLRTTVDRARHRKAAARRADALGKVSSAVLNAIDSPTVAVDGAGTIVATNQAWAVAAAAGRMGGPDAGLGHRYLDLCGPVAGAGPLETSDIADGIESVASGQRTHFSADYELITEPGRWCNVRVTPVGRVGEGVVLTHSDITQTRLAEEAMRLNGAALGDLVADASQLFVMFDGNGHVLHASDHTLQVLELDLSDLVSGGDSVHPADRAGARETYATALATAGVRQSLQLRVRARDGRWRRLQLVMTNLLAHPAVGGVVVTGNDVSVDRQSRIGRHFDGVFLDRLPAAVIVTDDVGVVVYWNTRATELLGHGRDEAMGRDIRQLTGRDDFAFAFARPGDDDDNRGGRWEGEATAQHKAGHDVPVVMTIDRVSIHEIAFDGIVATLWDNTERKDLEASLTYQAMHDPLTGLPNRGLFMDRLAQALARRARLQTTVAVFFVDLDRFKVVNDTLGHQGGDEVLRAVARRLQAVLRPDDTISRVGGDEFTVCCENLASAEEASIIADRLIGALAAPIPLGAGEHTVGASVGVAVATGRPHERPETLVQDADAAMYKAKNDGRGRHQIFHESDRSENARRTRLSGDLRLALERDELRLRYQPVYELGTGRIVGAEALLRWEHPDLGLLSPDDFIDIAEDTNLIVAMGRWVIDTALEELARWQRAAPESRLTMAVNVSARQIAALDLADVIRALLERHGIEPARLCLEITESTLLGDVDAAVGALRGLRSLGVQLAIDDFGTGYSSLAYLKRFPVDFLKIDRSFVHDMSTDTDSLVIVKAVIDLAVSLGLDVIAEGVETEEHAEKLASLGCGYAQGHLWCPATDAAALLALVDVEPRMTPIAAVPAAHTSMREERDVIATLAHELTTPLAVAQAALNVMEQLQGEEREKALEVAGRNCARAAELVRSLTDMELLDAGTIALETEAIDLVAIARETVDWFGTITDGRSIIFEAETDAPAFGDRFRVEQILTNLISNACKYSPPGTDVQVRTRMEGAHVVVAVTDAGEGIPADRVAEIFRKFGRLAAGATGVGLGLYLARKLARAQGGDVTYVPSQETGGSCFVLRLPSAPGTTAPPAVGASQTVTPE